IIARAVQVNAGLWAQALAISAGLGVFDAAGSDSGPAWTGPRGDMSATADGTSPSFAIDVALLGGMYAGKITLVGNESGVGVRNAGHIGASAGEVRLTADGRIENAGSVTGQGVRLQSQAGLANSGVVYAQGAATLATRGELSNSGLIAASGETALSASGAGARVIGLEGSALAAGLSADGELIEVAPGAPAPVGGVLRVSVEGTVALHGQNLASSEMAITGAAVDVAGSQTRAPVIVLSATTGGVDTSRAAIGAGQLLVVSAPGGLLRTDAAALSAPRLDLRALALSNVGGSLSQTGADGLSLRFADALDNSGGRIAASGPISVSTGRLVNAGGELVTDRSLSIDAVDADNRAGTLMAGGDLAVSAATVSNAGGSLVAGHAATLAVGDLNNTDGTVSAAHALTVLADGVRNDRGTLRAGADGEVLVRGTFDNAGGLLTAGGDLRVRANALSNHGTLYAGAQTRVDVAAGLINGGTLAAHGNTTLVARQIDSGAGSVLGAGVEVATTGVGVGPAAGAASSVNPSPSLVVFADRVAAHGRNTAPGLLRVEAGAINLSGSHTSAGDVVLTASAGDIATRNAQLSAAGSLTLRADGAAGQVFDNTGGAIVADAGVSIRVSRVDNTRGSIETAGAASLDMAASLSNAQGRISVGGDLALRATDVGPSGHLQAGRDLTLSASGDLRSDGVLMAGRDVALAANGTVTNQGTVLAQRDVAITSASLNNDGAIQAGRDLGLSVFAAVNHGGLRADRDLRLVADRVDSDGTVIAGRDLRLTATSVVSNGGVIAAGADLTAQAGQVVNAGRLQADRHVALDATGVVNSGRIDAAGHVVIRAGGTVDQTGVVTARGDVSVAAAQITADATSVFAAGLAATPATNTGSISPLPDAALSPTERGDLSLSAGRLGAHGQNVAAGAATFTGHSLDLSSSHTSAADIALWIGGEDLGPGGAAAVNTRGAVIAADHRLSLRPADDTASAAAPATNGLAARPSLDNGGGDLRAGSLDLRLSGLSNVGGSVVQTGGEALTLDVGGEIDNRGGRLASNAVDWTIAAARLIQTDGRIEHAGGGALTVNAGRIEGVRGELRSHGALRLTGGDVVLDAGQIVADRIALTAASLSNREGLISQLSGGALSIAVTGRFDNQDATLAGNADVAITAGELLNQGGSIQAAGANPDGKASRLRIDVAGRVDNQGGTLAAAGAAEVLADRL
ncbi:MAG: hypothetical protein JWP52_4002, partial [Rhizobacter sp.]|nr:hypothetical protein [Rhizobacter sp.]